MTHDELTLALRIIGGFDPVRGKGPGVSERVMRNSLGEPLRLTLLTNRKDATLLIHKGAGKPMTLRFRANFLDAYACVEAIVRKLERNE